MKGNDKDPIQPNSTLYVPKTEHKQSKRKTVQADSQGDNTNSKTYVGNYSRKPHFKILFGIFYQPAYTLKFGKFCDSFIKN